MKATIILSTLFFLTAWMGCSDSLNVTDPLNQHNSVSGEQKVSPGNGGPELIWKLNELSVRASNEFMVENKAGYSFPPFTEIASYIVSFDVYTDANKFTNGYTPVVKVLTDGETAMLVDNYPVSEGYNSNHKELRINNVRFNNITLYIALFQSDSLPVNEDVYGCVLRLSDIRIYRIN